MKLPDFLIIGAAKCGTTSLCDDLVRHPGIFMAEPKEPEYFCRDEKYALGPEWYAALFSDARRDQLVGEGSTHYTDFPAMPHSAERIAEALPQAKLVYMVRDPVKRAYSGWLQKLKNQHNFGGDLDVPGCFSEAIRSYAPLVDAGDYKLQIEQYLKHFDRGSIHVIVLDDYMSDRAAEVVRLASFLGIDPSPLLRLDPVWSNESRRHFETRARVRISQKIRGLPILGRAGLLFPRSIRRRVLGSIAGGPVGRRFVVDTLPARMNPEDEAYLRQRYQSSVAWLEEYLGRRLDWGTPDRGPEG